MNRTKKVVGGIATALLLGGSGALLSTPAHAVIPTDGTDVIDATEAAATGLPEGAVVQVKSAVDGGGVKHTFKIVWAKKYIDPVGTIRASVPTLVDYRSDDLTEAAGESADAGEDVHFDVSSHGTVRWTQHKVYDGIDLDEATDDQVSFNPRNPISDANDTFVRIRAGVDGDGAAETPFVYFVQPAGLPGPSA